MNWKTLVLSATVSCLSTITFSSKLLAQQITDDLFDLSQGTQIINTSPTQPNINIGNMFGAGSTAPNGDFRAFFQDRSDPNHFIEIQTPLPIILESFSLILLRDREIVLGNRRGASAFRLFALNSESGEFDILLFEQTGLGGLYGPVTSPEIPPSPFAFPFLELRIDSSVPEVVSSAFRAEFDQLGALSPAIYTLDGFGQVVPEQVPETTSTLALLCLGTIGAGAIIKRKFKLSKQDKNNVS